MLNLPVHLKREYVLDNIMKGNEDTEGKGLHL